MFPRKYRLPAGVQFQSPKVVKTPLFNLRIIHNSFQYNRYGFVISKKVEKRAVVRNRIKRQLRSVVENIHARLKTGNDMLFILNKNDTIVTIEELRTEIENSCRKVALL